MGDMSAGEDVQALRAELEALRQDFKKVNTAYKKQGRTLELLQRQIERNKIAADAKDNLSRVISAKRSELERYMNLLLGNCPDMILLFDEKGSIAYCTESFLKLCRIPAFGMIGGTPATDLLTPYTSQEFITQLEEVFARIYAEKKTVDFSASLDFSRDGNLRNYSIQVTPMLGEQGIAEGSMVIFSDTTEILQAQRDAEQANAAKSDFLTTVSHEIRTPMNAIIGVSRMLKSTGLSELQLEYLKNIQTSSHMLLNLIDDVLDLSKIEAGRLELIKEYFRVSDILYHLQSMFTVMFEEKQLRFVCEFSEELPEVVWGDDKRILQILTNILNNALKYTRQGSVWFRVYTEESGVLCFEVKDTGIGISKEALPRLFNAFEQLDLVRNKGVIGTGLGLAITKRLCESMGGVIAVESEFDVGSCFVVRLPLPLGTEEDLLVETKKEMLDFEVCDVLVLLVDDIAINLQVAAYMLELFGVQTESALSGEQAIEMVRENRYDMILMDHMMPNMDGVEATGIIRSLGGYAAQVPIVALTANAVSNAIEMFLRNGFDDYLSKPMDEAALAACLLKWLPEEKIVRRIT